MPADAYGPAELLAASGILASEYYAGQARAAEVTSSLEWVRTPSCNIARDEMAAQGVCDGPDDPLGAVAAPSASYAPLLGGLLAAVAVGAAAGGGGGSSSGGHTVAGSDAGGGGTVAGHPSVLAVMSPSAESSAIDGAAASADGTAAAGAGVDPAAAAVDGAATASLSFDAARLGSLESAARHGEAPHVDGTAGIDTLRLVGHSVVLDLDALSRLGAQFTSVEKIDLAGGGNRLAISAADVLQMSGTDLFNAGSGWSGLGTHVERHQVVVDGGAGDTLQMGAGWQPAGTTAAHDGHSYAVFNAADSMAQLLVATQVSVVG